MTARASTLATVLALRDAGLSILIAGLCLGGGLLTATLKAQAETPAPVTMPSANERQLDAIRQAISEGMLDTPTRVLSTAWIDAQGALHEDTRFNSEARVRGVRVTAYLTEAGGEPNYRASSDIVLPQGLYKHPNKPLACKAERGRWRMPLSIDVHADDSLHGQESAISTWLTHQIHTSLQGEIARSTRWYHAPAAPKGEAASPYWSALAGEQSPNGQWVLTVQLTRAEPTNPPPGPLGFNPLDLLRSKLGDSSPPGLWRIRLRMQPPGQASVIWESDLLLPHTDVANFDSTPPILNTLRTELAALRAQMDASVQCEPTHYPLRQGSEGWTLPIGTPSGLRAGDRVLIFDRQTMPKHWLEPGALQRMALAEVTSVNTQRTFLRPLAGPPLPATGDWVALPL